jgi:hypothetical protein
MATKKPLAQFWKALDEIPEATTDRREWSLRLGDDWQVAATYLTATGRLAKEVACPSPGGDGCPRKVVKHADGRFRAVCGNKPAECDPVDLTRDEITCLALDRSRLAATVRAMFKAEESDLPPGDGVAMLVGSHGVAAGLAIPIVLVIPGPMTMVSAETLSALGGEAGPVAVVAPSAQSIPKEVRAALASRGHAVLSLSEIITVNDRRVVGTRNADEMLATLREKLLTARVPMTSGRAWLLPADARWDELTFEFTAADVVNVRFRNETKRFEPEHFQMKDRRTGKPTEQWALLKIFAAHGGKLGWTDSGAKVMVKKRKQELGKKLRASFGLQAEPIVWKRGARVYQTAFSIRGDVLDDGRRGTRG